MQDKKRIYLFIGKRTDNGEWVEGYYFRKFSTFHKKVLSYIQIITKSNNVLSCIEVNPSTVRQYTEHNDKNDNKIFDGHILECINQNNTISRYLVVWRNGWKVLQNGRESTERELDYSLCSRSKIVGNIHDNLDELQSYKNSTAVKRGIEFVHQKLYSLGLSNDKIKDFIKDCKIDLSLIQQKDVFLCQIYKTKGDFARKMLVEDVATESKAANAAMQFIDFDKYGQHLIENYTTHDNLGHIYIVPSSGEVIWYNLDSVLI